MVASRLIKREIGLLPVDVRRSKTSLLKLPIIALVYHCPSVFPFYLNNVIEATWLCSCFLSCDFVYFYYCSNLQTFYPKEE